MKERPDGPRLILLATTHRVAPGLLGWPAWAALRSADRVLTGSADHPQLPYLAEAGVPVEVVRPDPRALVEAARAGATVWLAAEDGDEDLLRAVGSLLVSGAVEPVELEVLHGSHDLPGARVLDLVTVTDTLRRECPWDRKQTHASLVPYLIEEAYEVLDTVENGDLRALCEELGDVLMQVVFHARVAQERDDDTSFTIDDVAGGIVDKLVRRHPHVFGDVTVSGADEVNANWEKIKDSERAAKGGETSVVDGVPMAQPALSLTAQLQRRAERVEAPADLMAEVGQADPAGAVGAAGADGARDAAAGIGPELFALVQRARAAGVDPEAELRAYARIFRDRVRDWELTRQV